MLIVALGIIEKDLKLEINNLAGRIGGAPT